MRKKVIFLLIIATVLLVLTGCPWIDLKYSLTITLDGSGKVTPASGSEYLATTQVTLTAEPDPGWAFSHWSGDLEGSTNPASIVMDSDKHITAHFTEEQAETNVQGVVLDLETMQGIGGSSVKVYQNNTCIDELTSGTNGYFEVSLPQGTYTFIATAAGYVNNTASNVQVVEIISDTDIVNVSFALAPEGEETEYCSITGKVTDNTGAALKDVLVTLDGGAQTNGIFISKMTDANGNYFAYGIPLTDTNGDPLTSVKVTAAKTGYLPQTQTINLIANQTIPNIDFALVPGTVEETTYFNDNFENALTWDPTGFWHLQENAQIVNTAVPKYVTLPPDDTSAGYIPAAYSGKKCFWYGVATTGNFIGTQVAGDYDHSGGTSTTSNSGSLYSSMIDLTNATSPVLSFMTWYEIESVNPNEYGFDIMTVQIYKDGGTTKDIMRLNPFADPVADDRAPLAYTSGGFNQAAHWIPIQVDLSEYAGSTIQIIFTFDTNDELYNGFRGWFIDDVKVSEVTHKGADILQPQAYLGIEGMRH